MSIYQKVPTYSFFFVSRVEMCTLRSVLKLSPHRIIYAASEQSSCEHELGLDELGPRGADSGDSTSWDINGTIGECEDSKQLSHGTGCACVR